MTYRLLPILSCFVLACPATELVVRDLGLRLDSVGERFHWRSGTASGNDRFDTGIATTAVLLYDLAGPGRSHGAMIGLEAGILHLPYEDVGELQALTARVLLHYAWQVSDNWLVSTGPALGLGNAELDFGDRLGTGRGTYEGERRELMLQGLAAWRHRNWSLLLQVSHADLSYDLDPEHDAQDLELDGSSWSAGLGVSWRFGTIASGLE